MPVAFRLPLGEQVPVQEPRLPGWLKAEALVEEDAQLFVSLGEGFP